MKVTLGFEAAAELNVDLLGIGVTAGKLAKHDGVRALDGILGGAIGKLAKEEDFSGKPDTTLLVQTGGKIRASRLLLVGVDGGSSPIVRARQVAVRAAAAARGYERVGVLTESPTGDIVRASAEGVLLGSYRYTRYFTHDAKAKKRLAHAVIAVRKAKPELEDNLKRGVVVGEAVNLVRDLVNCPPNDMNPTALAKAAQEVSERIGISCKVFDKRRIEQEGMNLLLAVNRGSAQEPRFIHMTYKPKGVAASPRIVFVGKGLTFDAGGLCIKPAKAMADMKCDMAGGAVTIAVVAAAARLKLPVEVHGIVPATENMLGGDAYRPGDVFTSLEGKTVEIINTDAEGRLILADALSYATALKPDCLIDHATLTGACIVGLGPWTAGMFSNDERLARKYAEAAEHEGESCWRLPLLEDLRDGLKSDVADLKHTGESYGGAINAALFLREFIGDRKWVHMDIAGPAFLERPHGISPKGGTGFGVLTAIRFLESVAHKKR